LSYTLLVGPDSKDRAWVEGTLLRGGMEVATATEADVLVAKDLLMPRLLVLDDQGPRDARMATLRRLQAHPSLKGVPMLVLAYEGDVDSFTDAITKGVAAYLVKPVAADEFIPLAQRLSGWSGMIDRTERRRRVRRPIIMKVEIDVRARHQKLMGQMVDASGGGCRLEMPDIVAPGDMLRVILHSQDASTHVALGVEVRWSLPMEGGGCQAGCRFTGTTALLAGKMLGFVSSGLT
jgi:CheY-like chemotaxis protein